MKSEPAPLPNPDHPHVGLSAYRLHPDQCNPREVAFAAQWSLEQRQGNVLKHLLGRDYSDRDAAVAATVIQWLGSNVGMSFLEEAAKLQPDIRRDLLQRFGVTD